MAHARNYDTGASLSAFFSVLGEILEKYATSVNIILSYNV
jgi:hypothetical protein